MSDALLLTKLYVPPLRTNLVLRPRLVERLNEGLSSGRKLTLISAPAGFGKTTLVSEWLAGCQRPVAWLSLDEGDNDPSRFLTYLIAALQAIAANIGEGVLGVLQTPQPPSTESILTALLNEITIISDHIILVLDDYHLIDSKPIDEALIFLLEHLPPQMHLAIATREDPPMPLARLRARGQLTELRAADLRFTPAEAAEFLNRMMRLDLSPENISALEARTEGWIAGLQLAALALQGSLFIQGQPDPTSFIRSFTGSHRFILDYLVEEVLQRQPERVSSFLLQTSILDQMCGPLCDAVTGQLDGKEMLKALEQGNLFVIPLDAQRQWYRYHHLFADVLQEYLMGAQPERVSVLHRRASEWYEKSGLPPDAIRHALAAGDFARAADLIELVMPAMNHSRQFATLLGWLKALPGELVRVRPVLSTWYASVSMSCGELGGVEPRLRDAERWLDTTADTAGMVVVDEDEFRRVPGMIKLIRAGLALARGDMPETVKNARRVLDLAPEDDLLMLGGAASQLGLAAWTSGDLDTARRMTAEGMVNLRLGGYISAAIGGAIVLADIQIAQGCLHEAMTTYERALQLATEPGAPALAVQGAADMYVGMSALQREHNDLKIAMQHLLTSQALGELAGLKQNPYRWCAAMARIREARGDLDEALDLLDQAERLYDGAFSPNVRPVAARKARVWVVQGRLGEALSWAREQGLSVENELSYLHEFDHITLARVLLARYQSDHTDHSILEAMGLLERLLKAAEEGGRKGTVIEILVLQAIAYHAQGDLPAALKPLQKALTLAEPEDYVRMFVDEGSPMTQLLCEAASRGIMPDYTGKLLRAFEAEQPGSAGKSPLPTPLAVLPEGHRRSPPHAGERGDGEHLTELLSQRELEVLRMFKTELSGPEIARELVIALSTVRTHTKSIYSKLNVNNRRAAVKRAAELNLI